MIHFAVSKALTEKTVFNSIRTERAAAAESGLRIGKLPPLPSRREKMPSRAARVTRMNE